MNDDDSRTVEPHAYDVENGQRCVAAGENGEPGPTRRRRFKRTIGPVFEGLAAAVASTVVAGVLTVSLAGGTVFYTLTAFVLIALYLRHQL